jgi:hypothetical protein
MGAISTLDSNYDGYHHFKINENTKFAIPNNTRTIQPNQNPKPTSHLTPTLSLAREASIEKFNKTNPTHGTSCAIEKTFEKFNFQKSTKRPHA